MDGKYVYGIIDGSPPDTIGGPDRTFGVTGIGGFGRVYTVIHDDLGCVVSDYSSGGFNSMSKEEVVRCLLIHQVVIEQVMKLYTVLPMKFGTLLVSSVEVHDLLSKAQLQLAGALSWIRDKVEIEVAATWNAEQVLHEISQEEEIVRTRDAIASRPGQPTVEERIRLGQMVKASMDRRRDSYLERMIGFLKPVAVDVQPNALVSDRMVMNVAFLLEKAKLDEFDNRVSELNDLFHDQITFRIIGPLPPYSFATVEVTRPNLEEIEGARRLLALGGVISESEVRRAYRHLAAETHPDRKPGDELAKIQFAKLRQAADLLIAYCQGQVGSGGDLLVNIKRLKTDEVQHLRFAETRV